MKWWQQLDWIRVHKELWGPGLSVCTPVSSGASCGHACGGEGWLWQSRNWGWLPAWIWGLGHLWCYSWAGWGVGYGEYFTQLVSNTKTYGVRSSKNSRVSVVAMLTLGFLSGKSCWGPLQSSLLKSVTKSSVMKAEILCREGPWGPQLFQPRGWYRCPLCFLFPSYL